MTFLDDALSLPGLTLDLLYKLKDPNSFLVLFNQTHADLHTPKKTNCRWSVDRVEKVVRRG